MLDDGPRGLQLHVVLVHEDVEQVGRAHLPVHHDAGGGAVRAEDLHLHRRGRRSRARGGRGRRQPRQGHIQLVNLMGVQDY